MKYADHISGIINAFSLEPLKINQMRNGWPTGRRCGPVLL